MTEIVTRTDSSAPQLDLIWQQRLDALVCGECSEDDFMDELSSYRLLNADSAWSIVALLDQRYRRGQMPLELFRSIESKIAQRELGALHYGTTIELGDDIATPSAPPDIRVAAPAAAPAPRASPAKFRAVLTDAARPLPAAGIGRVLRDRYVLESRLGSGGMGTVYKALDRYRSDLREADRLVAIKILHEEAGGRAEVLANLRREFYCAQALSHPNIVKVYELDRDGDVEFFTMEYLEGELLSSVIEHLDPLSMSRSRAWSIILDIAAGLTHAHTHHVIHADLKPQNIMITESGEVRILDFGASSALVRQPWSAASARASNSSAVTLAYASCELLEGQRADRRDDLFALACLAYELLAGEHPFQRRRSTEARDLGLVIQRPRGLSRRQWRTLQLGLAWRREDRSISVRDWIARLHPGSKAAWRSPPASRTVALLAALFVGAALTLLLNRQVFNGNIADNAAVPKTAADLPIAPDSALAPSTEPAPFTAPAASAPRRGFLPSAKPAEAPQSSLRSASVASGAAPVKAGKAVEAGAAVEAGPVKAQTDTISISAKSYRVRAHKNFAEIHVRRSYGSGSDTSFAWWTEPSSALPDTDYVPQARTIQMLSKDSQMASLFVKLVPNVPRKHSAQFYVAIGEPSGGTSLGRVTRIAIVLPRQ